MASLCNYSHPELQITGGLVRQTSGSLFPYNPEFYKLATGLYGPGTIYCWYLLVASVIINWVFHAKDDHGNRRPGISNDLLAALAYPAFAATDALMHGLGLLGTEYRALAIFCLRNPEFDLTGFATFNHTQLDLRDIPPDILSLGQRVIDITGPLPVCYTFTGVMFVMVLSYLLGLAEALHWRPSEWAERLVCVTYGYVVLIITIFHLSLGDIAISMFLSFYEAILPFILFLMFSSSVFISIAFIGAIFQLVVSLCKGDKTNMLDAFKLLGSSLLIGAFIPGTTILRVYVNGIPLVPDLAISMSERDQIAALIGGIVTLCFTLGHVYRCQEATSASRESEAEEMQMLASNTQ